MIVGCIPQVFAFSRAHRFDDLDAGGDLLEHTKVGNHGFARLDAAFARAPDQGCQDQYHRQQDEDQGEAKPPIVPSNKADDAKRFQGAHGQLAVELLLHAQDAGEVIGQARQHLATGERMMECQVEPNQMPKDLAS
jgi:hypothetical protein